MSELQRTRTRETVADGWCLTSRSRYQDKGGRPPMPSIRDTTEVLNTSHIMSIYIAILSTKVDILSSQHFYILHGEGVPYEQSRMVAVSSMSAISCAVAAG